MLLSVKKPGCPGMLFQVISLSSVELEQPLAPVSVSVAVVEPDGVEGVNVASAGSGFCVHVPPAPLHTGVPLYEPDAEAPVIAIGIVPVQSPLISGPASALGAGKTVTVLLAVPVQPLLSVTVQMRSNCPPSGLLNIGAEILTELRNDAPFPFHE